MKKNRKYLAILLILALILNCTVAFGDDISESEETQVMEDSNDSKQTTDIFDEGDGTITNPYQVRTPKQLYAIRENLKAYYVQTADIDMTEFETWEPIGIDDSSEHIFNGSYDGNEYMISNLKIADNDLQYIGLFGACGENGNIKNVNLNNIQIEIDKTNIDNDNTIFVGGIAGYSSSVIDSCKVSGTIYVTNAKNLGVGGIGGRATEVTQSENLANIVVNSDDTDGTVCGGIVGSGESVTYCTNNGNVTASCNNFLSCGGITGEDADVDYCKNYGTISGHTYTLTGWRSFARCCNVGGIVGATSDKIRYGENYGEVKAFAEKGTTICAGGIAGFCGFVGNATSGEIRNCYNFKGNVKAEEEKMEGSVSKGIVEGDAGRIVGARSAWRDISNNYALYSILVNNQIVNLDECGSDTIHGISIDEEGNVYSGIRMTPADGSTIRDEIVDGEITLKFETTGQLEITNQYDSEIRSNNCLMVTSHRGEYKGDLIYYIYGNGTVLVSPDKNQTCSYIEAGIDVTRTEHSFEVTLPDLSRDEVVVEADNFFIIDGSTYNIGIEDQDPQWNFIIQPDSYDQLNVDNKVQENISCDIIKRIYSPAQVNDIYEKNCGSTGVCFGIALANAAMSIDDFFSLKDYEGGAENMWSLKTTSINTKENMTLWEYIQLCQVAQHLKEVTKMEKQNRSYGNNPKPEIIEKIVESVRDFAENDKSNPVLIKVSLAQENVYKFHSLLALGYKDEENETIVYVSDPNAPGITKQLYFYKENGEYNGRWYYSDAFQFCEYKNTYITYQEPLKIFEDAYETRIQNDHIMKTLNDIILLNHNYEMVQIPIPAGEGELQNNVSEEDKEKVLYWLENDERLEIEVASGEEVEISGDLVELSFTNAESGTVEMEMEGDNYQLHSDMGKDSIVEYVFYNQNDDSAKKVRMEIGTKTSDCTIKNNDTDIIFSNVDSIIITIETGKYDSEGNFIEESEITNEIDNLDPKLEYHITENESGVMVEEVKQNIIHGDIDFDGNITENDLFMCIHHISGAQELTDLKFKAADVNEDSAVNILDAIRILHYINGTSNEM